MKKVWFLFLLIFAVSCSDDGTNPTDGDVKLSETQSDWLNPLTIGNKWVYRIANDWLLDEYGIEPYNATLEITSYLGSLEWINSGRDGMDDTYEYTVTGMPEFDEESDEFLGFTSVIKQIMRGNSKYFYHVANEPEEPIEPYIFLDLENENPLSEYKYVGMEDVTIDGKVYKKCYKFESNETDDEELPIQTDIRIIYMKKGVGLVKQELYTLINETKSDGLVIELVSYSIK